MNNIHTTHPVIQVCGVSKYCTASENSKQRTAVLQDISFNIAPSCCAVISGESGSGKTTLLSIISGLDACSSGSVHIDGIKISSLSEKKRAEFRLRGVGFVFQHHYLLQDFTALGNVMLPLLIAGESKKTAHTKACAMLEKVGLDHRMRHMPSQLSGGERQRAAVARAVIHKPRVVIADEPTGALDTRNSKIIRELLESLTKTLGTTLLIATHDKDFLGIARMHISLKDGRAEHIEFFQRGDEHEQPARSGAP